MNHNQYTFTFKKSDATTFRNVLERLDPDEYTVVSPIVDHADPDHPHEKFVQTVMTMEAEAASTFRFSMRQLSIRRLRTEEEEAAEKALIEANTIRISVVMPSGPNGSDTVPGV